jgi:hypothetical protein
MLSHINLFRIDDSMIFIPLLLSVCLFSFFGKVSCAESGENNKETALSWVSEYKKKDAAEKEELIKIIENDSLQVKEFTIRFYLLYTFGPVLFIKRDNKEVSMNRSEIRMLLKEEITTGKELKTFFMQNKKFAYYRRWNEEHYFMFACFLNFTRESYPKDLK